MTKIYITDKDGELSLHRTFSSATNDLKSSDSDYHIGSSKTRKDYWIRFGQYHDEILRIELPIRFYSFNQRFDEGSLGRTKYIQNKEFTDLVSINLFHISKVGNQMIVGVVVDGKKMYLDNLPQIQEPSDDLMRKIQILKR